MRAPRRRRPIRTSRTRAFRTARRLGTGTAGFPDVEPLLDSFASGLTELLGEELVGAYLHGSLALGGFNSEESDVDFLVVTRRELDEGRVESLAAMHQRLGQRLDGSYLPLDDARVLDPARSWHPHIEARGGSLVVDRHGAETVIYRYVLRKCGVVRFGAPPQELIDPVTADELRAAVREAVADWWVPRVDVQPRDFADARYRAYMVVTMCRIRYTLARGDVVSKPAAARWAIAHLEPSRHSLIERAAAYGDCGYDETLAFVRETLALASC
jgi:predicted nucleotidyltransferase